MFATIIDYDNILDRILIETSIKTDKEKTQKLLDFIFEHPTISPEKLFNVAISIDTYQTKIFDGYTEFSVHPILNESVGVNLMEVVVPLISKYIPKNIIGHLTTQHAKSIVNSILDVKMKESDTVVDLRNRLDEMFTSGSILIPVSGFRTEAESTEVIMAGVFAPMVYKRISFNNNINNNEPLRNIISNYTTNEDTPLMKLLPKFTITMKDLLADKDLKC